MSDIVDRLRDASYVNAPSRCMEAASEIERIRKALEQIKVVCEDNRRARDIGPVEEMTLYFIQQISEQALRATVGSPGKS